MPPPRPVPGIARGPQQFSRDTLSAIQSPLMMPGQQQPQQSPEAAIAETMQELALEIYARLATAHIEHNQATDRETLQGLAQSAQLAAKSYFESMGVQFDG